MTDTGNAVVRGAKHVPEAYMGTIEPNYYCRGWNSKRLKYCKARAGLGTEHPGQGRCKNHGGATPIGAGRYSTIKRERIRVLVEEFSADPDPLNVEPEIFLARALLRDYIERYDQFVSALFAWHESYTAAERPISYDRLLAMETVVDELEALVGPADMEEEGEEEEEGARVRKAMREARKLLEDLQRPRDESKPRQMLDLGEAVKYAEALSRMVKRIEDVRSQDAISRRDLARILSEIVRSVDLRIKDPDVRQQIHDDIISIRL